MEFPIILSTFGAKQNVTANLILPKYPIELGGGFSTPKGFCPKSKGKNIKNFLHFQIFVENFLIKILPQLNG